MSFLFDTVALSDLEKRSGNQVIANFVEHHPTESIYVSSISIGEITFGWSRLPLGRRRDALEAWAENIETAFAGRVVPFDTDVARVWGEIRARTLNSGFHISVQDLAIAATAIHHDLTVITRNVRDFEPTGCRIVNPWAE